MCWWRARIAARVADAAAKIAGVEKVLVADDALYAQHAGRDDGGADPVAGGQI